MNEPCLLLPLPEELSDESVYELCELLEQLTLAFQSHYAEQLHRHLRDRHPNAQSSFEWHTDDDEPPF